jgi:lysophospholipase L1-like esterase
MAFSHLLARLWLREKPHSPRKILPPRHSARCNLELLEDRTVPSAFSFAAMGDSLTTHYSGSRASGGDTSWTDQLNLLRGDEVSIWNVAANGATSAGVAANQAPKVKQLVADGTVHYSVLEVGGNDERAHLNEIVNGNSTTFIHEVVANIEGALNTVASGGKVRQVLGLVPDIGDTPAIKAELLFDKTKLARLTSAVKAANNQLLAYASAHGIVVADVYDLGKLSYKPIALAGARTTDWWSADNFHPSSVPQALFANVAMRAFQSGYGIDTRALQLSDQEILAQAGDAGSPTSTRPMYYNVSNFVVLPGHSPVPVEAFNSGTAPFYPNLQLLGSHLALPAELSRMLPALPDTAGPWTPAVLAPLVPQISTVVEWESHLPTVNPSPENSFSHRLNQQVFSKVLEFLPAVNGLAELHISGLA